MSILASTEKPLLDSEKCLFDWCKEGNKEKLSQLLKKDEVDRRDESVS